MDHTSTSHRQQPQKNLANYLHIGSKPVIIVSDASLNSQKHGAFSWIIATTDQELWTGNGTVPGPINDAYSGRAEGFGVLAAFTFLEIYNKITATDINSRPTIQGHCDNLGLIQQLETMRTSKIFNPAWTIANDYDLYAEILQTCKRLPFPTQFHHVKGHQDASTPISDLPFVAQLNVECDKRARIAIASLPPGTQVHPSLPASFPHLQIN